MKEQIVYKNHDGTKRIRVSGSGQSWEAENWIRDRFGNWVAPITWGKDGFWDHKGELSALEAELSERGFKIDPTADANMAD